MSYTSSNGRNGYFSIMSDLKNIQILVVDDSPTIRGLISKYLKTSYTVLLASNGEEAWQLIQANNHSITLIFLDMHMPVLNGMLVLKQIRNSANENISNLPVIMITGHEDSEAAKQACYKMGATDFISKPFSEVDILSRITPYKEHNQKIAQLQENSSHDSLTGLYNKNGFAEIAEKTIAGAHRHGLDLSILNLQIVKMDNIASQYPQRIVDQLILSATSSLKKSLRREDVLSYHGSGRFSVLLPMTKLFKAHIVAMRFQTTIGKLAFKLDDETIRVKLAIGLSSTEGGKKGINFEDLNAQANQALEVSLQRPTHRVFRYDELSAKELKDEKIDNSTASIAIRTKKKDPPAKDFAEAAKITLLTADMNAYNNYMSEILVGNFKNIPTQHLADMIQPFESFLKYAIMQVEPENEKLKVSD